MGLVEEVGSCRFGRGHIRRGTLGVTLAFALREHVLFRAIRGKRFPVQESRTEEFSGTQAMRFISNILKKHFELDFASLAPWCQK